MHEVEKNLQISTEIAVYRGNGYDIRHTRPQLLWITR